MSGSEHDTVKLPSAHYHKLNQMNRNLRNIFAVIMGLFLLVLIIAVALLTDVDSEPRGQRVELEPVEVEVHVTDTVQVDIRDTVIVQTDSL